MNATLPTRFIPRIALSIFGFFGSALLFQPPAQVGANQTEQSIEEKAKRKTSFRSAVPKEIKIVAIRNVDDDDWYDKLEFEIENESKKDIWYIDFRVELPEYAKSETVLLAFIMEFGRTSPPSGGINNPNKPLIRPEERHVFRISQIGVENFKRQNGNIFPPVKHLRFELYKIYFTDGTGYLRGRAINRNPDGTYTWATQNISFRSCSDEFYEFTN